ncbi:MAG: HlyD family efflux transporter periplasmic adaptor subunit [Planctomycetaceae bacterium]
MNTDRGSAESQREFGRAAATNSPSPATVDAAADDAAARRNQTPIRWRMRPDLTCMPHENGGWILKDPLQPAHTFLDSHEYLALRALDGRIDMNGWKQLLQTQFPDHEIDEQELWTFLRRLIRQQLLVATVTGDSPRVLAALEQKRRTRRWTAPLKLMRLRLPLMDPTSLLKSIEPRLAFLYTRAAAVCFAILLLTAGTLVTVRFDDFRQGLPNLSTFASRENILLILAAFIVVKCCHELAHALTCVHFGAECRECGIMMLTFTPVLYTNVSDSWSLNRSHRLAVTAAGIVLELTIASLCVLLWWFAAPGTTRLLLMNTILLCSVTTVLFNGNPLLRFDGYFLLADLTGIPNLYQQASARVSQLARRYLFGVTDGLTSIRSRQTAFLTVYGLLAAAYRLLITFAIVKIVRTFARQWQQEAAGQLLSWFILATFLVMPLALFVGNTAVTALRQRRGLRPLLHTIAFCAVAWLVLSFRWPYSVTAPCTFLPKGEAIYVTVPGDVISFADYGQVVQAGDEIARLSNTDIDLRVQAVEAELRQHENILASLETVRASDRKNDLATTAEAIAEVKSRLASLREQARKLSVEASTAGVLLPPQERVPQPDGRQLSSWTGLPLTHQNRNAHLDRGTVLGHIGDPRELWVVAFVDEAEVEFVAPGSLTTVASLSGANERFQTIIEEVSQETADSVPIQISVAGLNKWRRAPHDAAPPLFRCSGVLTVRDSQPVPNLYSVGQVRIHGAERSLLERLRRYLARTF